MRYRDHLFAILIHGGILLAITILVINSGCSTEEEPVEPDLVAEFFDDIQESLDEMMAESMAVISVDDSAGVGENIRRQVFQETHSRLLELESVAILEYPESDLSDMFTTLNIEPAEGISPELAIELASMLKSDALLYASIESSNLDVYFKIYAGDTGAVSFSDTLEAWVLPVKQEDSSIDFMLDESLDGAEGLESLGGELDSTGDEGGTVSPGG